MNKATTIKALWELHDSLSKTLKSLQESHLKSAVEHNFWCMLEQCQKSLKLIERFQIGSYYYCGDDPREERNTDTRYYIYRLEDFIPKSHDIIGAQIRILSSTHDKINYEEPKDLMVTSLDCLGYNDNKAFNPSQENLPLLLGNVYNGSLLRELLKA